MLPDFLLKIPFSTIFILLLAATISLLTSLTNRRFTNPEKSKAQRKEVAEWNAALRKAQRSGDKKLTQKLMKKQQYILGLQSKMMWQSMKVMLIFLAPLFIMWQVLGGSYGSTEIAYFPGVGPVISLPLLGNMTSLFWWYLLCSFLCSTMFSHLFGLVSTE